MEVGTSARNKVKKVSPSLPTVLLSLLFLSQPPNLPPPFPGSFYSFLSRHRGLVILLSSPVQQIVSFVREERRILLVDLFSTKELEENYVGLNVLRPIALLSFFFSSSFFYFLFLLYRLIKVESLTEYSIVSEVQFYRRYFFKHLERLPTR